MYVPIHLSIYLSICLSIYLSIDLSIYLSIYTCLYIRTCMYIYANIYIYMYRYNLHIAYVYIYIIYIYTCIRRGVCVCLYLCENTYSMFQTNLYLGIRSFVDVGRRSSRACRRGQRCSSEAARPSIRATFRPVYASWALKGLIEAPFGRPAMLIDCWGLFGGCWRPLEVLGLLGVSCREGSYLSSLLPYSGDGGLTKWANHGGHGAWYRGQLWEY